MKRLLLSILLLGVSLFVGCGGSSSGNTPPPTVTLLTIQVTPANPSITAGNTQQFAATGTYSDGSTKVLTSTANWLSSATTVATISVSGLATGVSAGTTTISANSAGITGTTVLTVTPVPLVSIAVTPPTATVVPPTGTQQYTAIGTYANHTTQDITSTVTWSASVGATITAGGLATGVTPGTSTIMATLGSVSGTATLTITNPLVTIAVSPQTVFIAAGTNQQFTATAIYFDGTKSDVTTTATWSSSDINVATISNSPGIQGRASAVTAGTATITATLSGQTGAALLTVTSATLNSIAVTPANTTIIVGNQQQYTATGTFSDLTTQDITGTVTWTSSDKNTVQMTVSGLATGVAPTSSPVTITAAKNSIQGTATASVVAPIPTSIAITPTTATLAQGTSRQLTATATYSNGSTKNITNLATWSSSDGTIATVNGGLVKAAATVTQSTPITISAIYLGQSGTLPLNVTNATVNSITVTPITATIPAGVTQQFNAIATFSDTTTQDVSSDAVWVSDAPLIAIVSTFGRAAALTPGIANITATFGGQSGTAQLTVSTATLKSIAINPAQTLLAPGSTITYLAVGTYSDGTTQFLGTVPTWSSSDPSVVSITPHGGVATGQSAGSAAITATYQGVTSSSTPNVIVTSSALNFITVSPPAPSVPVGVSTQYTAIGTFLDTTTQNLTTNVTWASGQPSIATVSNAIARQGLATGVTPGQTAITAVFAGVVGNATLTVTNATIVSIAVAPPNPNVALGTSVNFTAKGTFSDGSLVDLTSQTTWSSGDVTVATINGVGLANTAKVGTTLITASFGGVSGTTNLTVH